MKRLLLIALLLPALAWAEITPNKSEHDPHVRIVDYDPLNVVRIDTFYGVSTHVQFSEDEIIKDIGSGDDAAWYLMPRANHLFIKPKAVNADTNLTVITNKRSYQFALVLAPRQVKDASAWRDPNLVYSLRFRYPADEAARLVQTQVAAVMTAWQGDMKTRLSEAKKRGENFDYWVAGSAQISPTAARDDGRFTYLTFSNNRDMPAVYQVEEDGSEALINTSIEDGNTIVVHRVVKQLKLRKGNYVACVVNKAFDLDSGKDNTTGTIAPDVQRIIKGAK